MSWVDGGDNLNKVSVSPSKMDRIKQLSNNDNVIAALAIDQRGSLKSMLATADLTNEVDQTIVEFKKLVSKELTNFSSSILLDPEYGLAAANVRAETSGLLLAYEKTGYDATKQGRLPDLLDDWSVHRLKNKGADAVKFLLYYDPDETESINIMKHVFMERIGAECKALDMPFFLEIVTYDANNSDVKGADYAKVKPYKVINAMKEFSKAEYFVDVLKVEVPVNMNYVEGFNSADQEVVYTTAEAMAFFKEQSESTHIPFIFLSAGVSMNLFKETLKFAKRAGSTFNGVLCGRATWKDSASIFSQDGEDQTKEWLQSKGRDNIESLNDILKETATSWTDYYIVE